MLLKILHADVEDVPVENACGDEQGFALVVLLLMEVEYFLDAIGPIVGREKLL